MKSKQRLFESISQFLRRIVDVHLDSLVFLALFGLIAHGTFYSGRLDTLFPYNHLYISNIIILPLWKYKVNRNALILTIQGVSDYSSISCSGEIIKPTVRNLRPGSDLLFCSGNKILAIFDTAFSNSSSVK